MPTTMKFIASGSACRVGASTSSMAPRSRTKPTWTSSMASTSTKDAMSARRLFRGSSTAPAPATASYLLLTKSSRRYRACRSWPERSRSARPDRGCFGCEHDVGSGWHHHPRAETILGEVRLARRGKGDLMSKVIVHADGLVRCPWPKEDPLYVAYHDDEWGVPEFDDRALFEKLVLDGFQAGLSWITILRKRDNFRRAFN